MKPTPEGWPRISSALYYADAARAIDWLCEAFGFEVRIKVETDDGHVAHSELTFGGGVVMVAEAGAGESPGRAPSQLDGRNTQSLFLYVDDAEAHCERARKAGARIVTEPTVTDYGEDHWADKGYACVDPEGHHWWFAERVRPV